METHHRSGSTRSIPTTWPLTTRSVYAGLNLAISLVYRGRHPVARSSAIVAIGGAVHAVTPR